MILRRGFFFLSLCMAAACTSSSTDTGTTTATTTGGGEMCGGVVLDDPTYKLTVNGVVVPTEAFSPESETVVEGKVLSSNAGTVTVDTCPPGMPCPTTTTTLEVAAPDLPSLLVPPGAFVRLRFSVTETSNGLGGGTLFQSLIENLPEWMGSPNPISTTSRIWFATLSSSGPLGVPPTFVPYQVSELSCGGCWSPDDKGELSLHFPGMDPLTVAPGSQVSFDATGSLAAHYVFQGLGASKDCEGYGSLSYWLTGS